MIDSKLHNTDFGKAIRKNKRKCLILVGSLLLLLMTVGYILGSYLDYEYLQSTRYHEYVYFNRYYLSQGYANTHQLTFPTSLTKSQLLFLNEPFCHLSELGIRFSVVTLILGMLWSVFAILFGGSIILSTSGATKIDDTNKNHNPEYAVLSNVLEEMSLAAGIVTPQLYLINTEVMNAFAIGMKINNSAISVTKGLLDNLTREELQGVIAHEISHIINYDTRFQTLMTSMVGLIIILADVGQRMVFYSRPVKESSDRDTKAAILKFIVVAVFFVIAPFVALIVQAMATREREYLADATSVKLTRNPLGLISALHKLHENSQPFDGANKANQNLFIVNPFENIKKKSFRLFSTHPDVLDRIERLRNLDK